MEILYMKNEWIEELDELLLKLVNSSNVRRLSFDRDGESVPPKVDKSIEKLAENLMRKNSPKFLYRYRPVNDRELIALQNNHLWLSTFKEFNDPFENKVFFDVESIVDSYIATNINEKKGVNKNQPAYISCIAEMKKIIKNLEDELEIKRNRAFIACFCENYNSLLMWAHYANGHKGICICYRYEDLVKAYGVLNVLPVTYTENFYKFSTFDEYVNNSQIFIKLCKTKSLEWAYEKEWRLMGGHRINDPYCPGKIVQTPKPYSIYMGAKIDEQRKSQLIGICKEKNIKLYQMRPSERGYRLLAFETKNR